MITIFSCENFFKFVSFSLYPTEATMLKCSMLGAFTVDIKLLMVLKESNQTNKQHSIIRESNIFSKYLIVQA